MTTSSRKNYNNLALSGQDIDDMEFVEFHKLDPALAYTPELNDAILDKVMAENIEGGMDPQKAKALRYQARVDIMRKLK